MTHPVSPELAPEPAPKPKPAPAVPRRVHSSRAQTPRRTFGGRLLGGLAVLAGLVSATAAAAPEIDRDAYWIESSFCAVTMRLRADTPAPDVARLLVGLVGAPAHCAGNMASPPQPQPGGVLALLQRGFRITAAQHQVVPLAASPARGEPEPGLLVTALFVLEKPAVKPAPPPK